ncbi:MAG: hypothetical protein LBR79_05780 [Oscillospiraceae bacterium]|nr:hypothetical protein [Oscillospiraceae bacterium]
MLLTFSPAIGGGKKEKCRCFKKIFIINSDATYVFPATGEGKKCRCFLKFLL